MNIQSESVIQKMLVISTAHIEKETAEWLSDTAIDGGELVVYEKGEYGFHIHVDPDEQSEQDVKEKSIPEELLPIISLARQLGCDWIVLDADAYIIEELEVFEW
ncbi:hypothetical protein ACFOQM_09630 [Paenibacillus sp. GCM10012307]|uniref:DUF5983 domain-containing protein n=1 Tax=Paenibacillus roseus TaxID=2798579 RepID=A0A934IYF3_9BACL|nr:hypothetical protein [Paenibacillus roseus]MBJ6361546.1 hypothetical protein [Paenibacillus roseus]